MSRQLPIDRAYQAANDALSRECSHCGAAAGVYCSKPDRRLSRVPCVSRCKPAPEWAMSTSTPAAHIGRDFSEPLYAAEES